MSQHQFRTQNGIQYLKDAKNDIELALCYMEVNPNIYRNDYEEAIINIVSACMKLQQATIHIMRDL